MNAMFDDRLNAVVYALGWTLLHFIWQGGLLAGALGLAMVAMHQRSARSRYLIAFATLLAMALSPLVTFMWMWDGVIGSFAPVSVALGVSTPPLDGPAAAPLEVNASLLIIVILWLLGAAGCTLWFLGGLAHAHRLSRLPDCGVPARCRGVIHRISTAMRVRASVRLVASASVAVPVTVGWLAPVVLLPVSTLAGLSARQLEAIIAHEFAHIRRFDYLANLLQVVIESLLFYHPAVWWVSHRIRSEREYCCDDLAAMACGDRLLYARALTELEALRSASIRLRLGPSSNGGSLMNRITRLLEYNAPAPTSSGRLPAALAAGALLASASAALAFMNPQAIVAHATEANVDKQVVPPFEYVLVLGEPLAQRPQDDARAAYIERALLMWDIQSTPTEFEANGQVWNLMQAVAQEVDRASDTFDATPRALLNLNTAYGDEMPSEELQQAARQLYPFNLFELMPWISPAAHPLIRPVDEENQATTRLESFSMPEPGKWIAVLNDPSAHTEIHGESTNGEAVATWARAVSCPVFRVEHVIASIERPALQLDVVFELPPLEGDAAIDTDDVAQENLIEEVIGEPLLYLVPSRIETQDPAEDAGG